MIELVLIRHDVDWTRQEQNIKMYHWIHTEWINWISTSIITYCIYIYWLTNMFGKWKKMEFLVTLIIRSQLKSNGKEYMILISNNIGEEQLYSLCTDLTHAKALPPASLSPMHACSLIGITLAEYLNKLNYENIDFIVWLLKSWQNCYSTCTEY